MHWIACVFFISLLVDPITANAQSYPLRPVRIVTGGVGGGSDFAARFVAQGLTTGLGQPFFIDNRGSGIVQGEIVSKSAPDGYTLLVAGGTLWTEPLMSKTPYDPINDFSPISLTQRAPNILVVHPSLPVSSVRDLIRLAKNRPGALNYSTGQSGSSTHLAGELFKSMAGVDIVRIPYKSGATRMSDLIGGQVQLEFSTAGSVAPYLKSGRLRALAVTSAEPSPLFPGLPTVAASGLPGYESVTLTGMWAPAKTPAGIIGTVSEEIGRYLGRPEIKEKLLSAGIEAIGTSPELFAAIIKTDSQRLRKLIKEAGIRPD